MVVAKASDKLVERRRYLRLKAPINLTYTVPDDRRIYKADAKDISADGLRFETKDKALKESGTLELKLDIPGANNPVHAKGRVIWKKKLTLEDAAPFDIGLEFTEIEEDNKNTFLKFLCDLIYNLPKETNYAKKKP